jgi:CBS domain containing-hemolysin-like protein
LSDTPAEGSGKRSSLRTASETEVRRQADVRSNERIRDVQDGVNTLRGSSQKFCFPAKKGLDKTARSGHNSHCRDYAYFLNASHSLKKEYTFSMITLVLTVVLVLLASALCSGSEAALFSMPLLKARKLAESKEPSELALLEICEQMNRPITTIVILNNLANIGGSILVGNVAISELGSRWLGVFSAILTLLVIIFSEIIPKTIGEHYAEPIALFIARPVQWLTRLFFPLVWCLEKLMRPLMNADTRFTTNEAEIKLLANIGKKEGIIQEDESVMIHRIFELDDRSAADIMTPRVTMTFLQGHHLLQEVRDAVIQSPHSRIVVVKDTPDDVLGVVLKSELLQAMLEGKTDQPVTDFMHEVHFVPNTKRADTLLSSFRESRQHLAVVVDEYGGIEGVVTLEDVLEVLTGEIVDETDRVTDLQALARKRREKLPISS